MKTSKWFLLFLALCLVFSLAACGGGGGGSDINADNGDDPAGGGGNSAPAGPWLCFTALTADSTISTTNPWGTVANTPSLEYSYDGENWEPFALNNVDPAKNETVTLANAGDKVYLRATGTNDSFSNDGKYINFTMEGSISASGNIMSLLDKTCTSTTIPCDECFSCLFAGCSVLVTAPELPATTLTYKCYNNMFYKCTDLTTAPDLPAMTLANNCYEYMFARCTNLTTVPHLPAMTLANSCYMNMFLGCSSLTTVPVPLPAITLAMYCYASMFSGCSSLTTAPELPATNLADYCYAGMFYDCKSLNSITVHFTKWVDASWNNATMDWVDGDPYKVPPGGTFTCPNGLPEEYGVSRIPDGWTYDNSL